MRKLFTLLIVFAFTACLFSQSPERISYQAVIRNASGGLVTSQPVGMQISILQGSATGTELFVETQTPTTNENGLVTVEIGGGTPVTGTLEVKNWSAGPYFIKTETDPTGGTAYTISGTSQLLSVPYALYAKTSEKADELEWKIQKLSNTMVAGGVVTDYDGNIYNTVKIGTQTWMAENLKTTRYNDGSDIPLVTDSLTWLNLSSPGYCWYKNNESAYKDLYGGLYNWYCIGTGNLCPDGWHVPTDAELTTLEIYLQNNGYNYDGIPDDDNNRSTNNKTAKALASATGWIMVSGTSGFEGVIGRPDYPDKRNASGFSALPASRRDYLARFLPDGYNCDLWCATESGVSTAYNRTMTWNQVDVIRYSAVDKKMGFSVRCIKD